MTTAAGAHTAVVVVIPCGRQKLDRAAPAGELYVGSMHREARRAADRLTESGGTVLILSAKHGLIGFDTVIEPYDMTIGHPDAVTAAVVRGQAAELIPAGAHVVGLLPLRYAALLGEAGVAAEQVLAGTRGIGYQKARLTRIRQHCWDGIDTTP